MIKLTNRLTAAADLVRDGRLTADIGTDHGYLPAFLVMSGKTDRVIAADIGEGPLENAEKTVRKYFLEDKISLVISDGLKNIPHDTEEIVIAGMGGTLIVDILSVAEWIKNDRIHLVLQPMTHSYDVRKFLTENGFYIDNEKFCTDDGRIYVVISAYFSGKDETRDDFYYFFGGNISMSDDLYASYFKKQYNYIKSRYEGLRQTEKREEAEKYLTLLKRAEKIYEDQRNL